MLPYFNFHHIGIACFDIDKTAHYYIECGYSKSPVIIDPLQNVKVSVLVKMGMPTIELLAPVDDKSPICKILQKSGVIPYHICYVVSEMKQAIEDLKKEHFMLISKPLLSNVFNEEVCLLFNKHVGVIEILEKKV